MPWRFQAWSAAGVVKAVLCSLWQRNSIPSGLSYQSQTTMRAIIIGAGRGRRLMPTTADTPKCFAEVQGKRLLDWTLQAFAANGIDDICFIGGYRIEKVRADLSAIHLPRERRLGEQQHPASR